MATVTAPRRVDLPGSLENASTDTIGDRVAGARLKAKLTQEELGKRIGKSRATVVAYEMNHIRPPAKAINEIARVCKETPEFITFGRHALEGMGEGHDMQVISEVANSLKNGFQPTSAHALGRQLLDAFGVPEEAELVTYVLTHDCPHFNLKAGSRVVVDTSDVQPTAESHRKDLYLVKTNQGCDIVQIENSFLEQAGKLQLLTSVGRSVTVDPATLTVLGAIYISLQAR